MRKSIIIIVSFTLFTSQLFTSCDANNTQKGAGIGAAAGAILGGVLGNNLGNGGNGALGAVLGAAIGGAAGGLIGNKMDKQAREIENALPGAQVERVGESIKLTLGENSVNFELAKANLTNLAKANLDKLVPVFNAYPDTNINIYGHTDSTGKLENNIKLSMARSNAVKDYLISKGLKAERFITKGLGPDEPIDSNETEEGRRKNRRVEFGILANQKMINDAAKEVKN
jgi:outer membrane protein OmpA-like peptidoglycan-associated protein